MSFLQVLWFHSQEHTGRWIGHSKFFLKNIKDCFAMNKPFGVWSDETEM